MKKVLVVVLSAVLALGLLAGCAASTGGDSENEIGAVPTVPDTDLNDTGDAPVSTPASEAEAGGEAVAVRVGGLKGPTTMGMVRLMERSDAGETDYDYQVEMHGTADAIVPLLVSGELDFAAIPANLASVLYNNTNGAVQVAAINTLGVLYVVETGEAINSVEGLRGKTLYSTGKGTTPEFALNYILTQNGIDPENDLTIEFKSESTEIAALLAEGEDAVAVLPQPYVTAVQAQNERVRVALDLTEEWSKVSTDSSLVTGVLVMRKAFLQEQPEAATAFLADYRDSIEWVVANTADAAELVAHYEIVAAAPVAAKALPECNIVHIAGEEMKQKLGGYLQVLYNQLPESVGGAVPGDDFYFLG